MCDRERNSIDRHVLIPAATSTENFDQVPCINQSRRNIILFRGHVRRVARLGFFRERTGIWTIQSRLGGCELTSVVVFGVSKYFLNASRFDNLPVAHHNHFIAVFACQSKIVSDQDEGHRSAFTQFTQKIKNFLLSRHIQSSCRLIRNENSG